MTLPTYRLSIDPIIKAMAYSCRKRNIPLTVYAGTKVNPFKLTQNFIFTLLFILTGANAFATWSIIIIDPRTKEIGIAGASCTYNVYGIGAIAPGKGAIVVQAMSNNFARSRGLQMILSEAPPEKILEAIKDPMFDPEDQQYGIVCLYAMDKPQTYTGDSAHTFKGALTARGVSVQGNTLSDQDEIKKIMEVVLKGQRDSLPIDKLLMLALEAGAEYGGDRRCGVQKATSAFITVARPDDDRKHPYLDLVVFGIAKGGENAVGELRKKYDAWKKEN